MQFNCQGSRTKNASFPFPCEQFHFAPVLRHSAQDVWLGSLVDGQSSVSCHCQLSVELDKKIAFRILMWAINRGRGPLRCQAEIKSHRPLIIPALSIPDELVHFHFAIDRFVCVVAAFRNNETHFRVDFSSAASSWRLIGNRAQKRRWRAWGKLSRVTSGRVARGAQRWRPSTCEWHVGFDVDW